MSETIGIDTAVLDDEPQTPTVSDSIRESARLLTEHSEDLETAARKI